MELPEERTSKLLNRVKEEYIICAGVHYDDGKVYDHQPKNISTGFVVAGRRHHNCIITLAILSKKDWRKEAIAEGLKTTQGFLTSKDRFLDRKEAWNLALESNQIETDEGKDKPLFSEDLY
jgi:hypothetical protein